MKKILLFMMLIVGMAITSQAQDYRHYVKKQVEVKYDKDTTYTSVTGYINLDGNTYEIDSTQWFAPVANLSVIYFNKDEYKVGIIPGLGYGWQYKPTWFTGNESYLVSIQAFLQAGVAQIDTDAGKDNYLSIGPSLGVGILGGKLIAGYSVTWDVGINGTTSERNGMWFLSTTLIKF